jgi:hypothetical protein
MQFDDGFCKRLVSVLHSGENALSTAESYDDAKVSSVG